MHGRKNARRETRVVVLTGPPCCGKTTLVKKLAAEFAEHAAPLIVGGLRVCGFVTEELRGQNGQRTGFDVLSIDGSKRSALARRDGPEGWPKVGKYCVDTKSFERVALPALARPSAESVAAGGLELLFIDEVGAMELHSEAFVEVVDERLRQCSATATVAVAVVAQKGAGLIAAVKARDDASLFTMSVENRDGLESSVLCKLKGLLGLDDDVNGGWTLLLEANPAAGGGAISVAAKKNAQRAKKKKERAEAAAAAAVAAPAELKGKAAIGAGEEEKLQAQLVAERKAAAAKALAEPDDWEEDFSRIPPDVRVKRSRAIKKKLRQIEELRQRQAGGEKLAGAQLAKLAEQPGLERDLDAIAALEAAPEPAPAEEEEEPDSWDAGPAPAEQAADNWND